MAIEDVEGVPPEVLKEIKKQLDQIEQDTYQNLVEAHEQEAEDR